MYGRQLIMDLYGCNPESFTRESIEQWLIDLCELIDMQREDLHFWDYEGCPEEEAAAPDHLAGTSAVQFITTSDIVVHTIDRLGECYIDLFTCKAFEPELAIAMTKGWFEASDIEHITLDRGRKSKCKQLL